MLGAVTAFAEIIQCSSWQWAHAMPVCVAAGGSGLLYQQNRPHCTTPAVLSPRCARARSVHALHMTPCSKQRRARWRRRHQLTGLTVVLAMIYEVSASGDHPHFKFRLKHRVRGAVQQSATGVPGYVAAGGGVSPASALPATRIITMTEAVTPEELASDEEYADILEDMREECNKARWMGPPPSPGHTVCCSACVSQPSL